jgi:uncharacterized protein DUF6923
MRPLIRFIAAGMLAVAAFAAHAATIAYGEAFDTLYRLDLDARTATSIGPAGSYGGTTIGNISGLTQASDGTLYAVAGGLKLLLRIDRTRGSATVLGNLGLAGQGSGQFDTLDLGMIAGCHGTLWLSSAVTGDLWTVDPQDGATTLVGNMGHAITGLVERNGTLYGAGGKGDNTFYRIDRRTGAATAVGAFGVSQWINSVALSVGADGTLWAVLNYVPPQHDTDPVPDWNDLATIDPATGAMTIIGPITGPPALRQVGMKGFTTGPAQCRAPGAVGAPVDAPWALGLLGLLLAAAAGVRGRGLRA